MAALDDLINKIENPELKLQIQHVVRKLLKQKKFGLVFEDHLPESTILQGLEVRTGLTVTYKVEPLKERFFVRSINNGIAECISLDDTTSFYNISVNELVPFSTFGEPIYPYLQIQDSISNAPDSPLWHSLIQSDNYHALQLLAYLYPGKVDCIYIDPPYNTGARDWKYNNNYVDSNDSYRHSKWLSMMKKRLLLAKKLLNPNDSVLIVTIDEKEYNHLGCLLEEIFPNGSIQMVTSVISGKGVSRTGQFSRVEEYIFIVSFGNMSVLELECNMLNERDYSIRKNQNDIEFLGFRRRNKGNFRTSRPNQFYPIIVDNTDGHIVSIGDVVTHGVNRFDVPIPDGCTGLWPLDPAGNEKIWSLVPESARELLRFGGLKVFNWNKISKTGSVKYLASGTVSNILNGTIAVDERDKYGAITSGHIVNNDDSTLRPRRVWNLKSHNASSFGTVLLKKFLVDKRFDFPKSLYAVHDTLRFFVANKPNALIVDFFAGSGTTLHAVNLLNAEDGGNRRCIMVTNNEVGEDIERELTTKGFKPGDEQWESLGIAQYVTWPRTVSSITGLDVKGQPINGEYLTYLTIEKEFNLRFQQVSFVRDFATLSLTEKKDFVAVLSKGAIAKSLVSDDTAYIIDEDSAMSILLDGSAASDWLDELEGQDSIRDFIICTVDKKLFNSLKRRITETFGTFKEQVPMTLPMSQGFKANAIFFKLGFLDKQAVQMGRQFAELLPLLWMKSGAYGVCPQVNSYFIPSMLILPQNKFAVLTNENEFGAFSDTLATANDIETAYIVTDSERGYREMAAQLRVRNSYQLYRDYLDNFTINTKGSI